MASLTELVIGKPSAQGPHSLQDSISLMQDKLSLQIGVRNSSIDRDFINYANAGTYGVGRAGLGLRNLNAPTAKCCQSFGAKYNLDAEQSCFLQRCRKLPCAF
jgi:iron complex outermembrane receptor protein